jgi:hypothetical protein
MRRSAVFFSFVRFILSLIVLEGASAQEMKQFINRVEGTTIELHGDRDITLLGLHRKFESFSKNSNLAVRFYLPSMPSSRLTTVFVDAREIVDTHHYMMQSTQKSWMQGSWNTFNPWPTKDVIDRLNIATTNIAVVAGYRDEKGLVYIPVDVSHAGVSDQPYSLWYETSYDLQSLDEVIIDSSNHMVGKKTEECTISPNCILFPAASSHAVSLDLTKQNEGIYTILLIGHTPRSSQPWRMQVRIYHTLK